MRLPWLLVALLLASLLLILHLIALSEYWYWYYSWFDIPMHLLGGVAIGVFLLALFGPARAVLYFGAILAVVVGWEIFENINAISTGQPQYELDTALDIVNGTVGAAATYLVTRISLWRCA